MAHQGFSQGQVPAAYAKALAAEAATRGVPVTLGVTLESLADETQPLALATYLAALHSAPDLAASAQRRLLDEPQLALWSRLLRRARSLDEAFELLGSEEVLGSASFYVEGRGPNEVRGRFEVRHDPRLEEDPALQRARAAVLALVPELFGHGAAQVQTAGRDLVVRWRPLAPSPAFGIAAGGLVTLLVALWRSTSLGLALALVGGFATACIIQITVAAQRRARGTSRAMQLRGAVLERQLTVAEEARPAQLGDFAGTVVAGLYRIERRMGTGATGVVYAARRITDQLPVAIKLLRAATAHDVVASDRLRREAEALGLAWHPNVVEVLDHGMLPDGTSYMVMEALEGESLADRLARGPLAVADALVLGQELCAALVAVHAAGVVHRDVKPDNVFLVESDEPRLRVKLLDFGIAKVEWEELRITHSGGPLGTPGFMAPEQERGEDADARADVYSLGAVLAAALAGSTEAVPTAVAAMIERARSSEASLRPSLRELGSTLAAA